jgi:hypothetical protein
MKWWSFDVSGFVSFYGLPEATERAHRGACGLSGVTM